MADAGSAPEHNPADWEQVKELVYQWQMEQPADLNHWLDERSPSPPVRLEVERIVRASATSTNFMQGNAAQDHLGVSSTHPVHIGRYRVIEEIGSGGLGIVYAAYDPSLERKVAIKLLAGESGSAERRKRLRWDAKAASAARHPNIVIVYDIGSDSGRDYIVMECVEGQSLSKLLAAGPLPMETTLKYALQIADALETAHRAGIIHRDLKPGNIMIGADGAAKILDFGLAKQEDTEIVHSSQPATIEGHFAGTVAYVSPEQAEGKAVDARGDVFSFGCILFEMLTGKQAFQGATPVSVLGNILHQPGPLLRREAPQVDPRFDDIVEGCLKKKAADRFASMSEVRARLAALSQTTELRPHFSLRTRRRIMRGSAIGAAVAFAALVIVLVVLHPFSERVVQFDQLRITHSSGLASFPAISLNGEQIAFASDEGGGQLKIWVQHWAQEDPLRITDGPANDYSPSFSANGNELVYQSDQDGGGLYRVSALGGQSRRIIATGRDGRFSPDGKWIAYWTGEVGAGLASGSARLYIMPEHAGQPQEFPGGFDVAAHPIWLADDHESKLLFFGRKTGDKNADWWIADVETRSVRPTGILQKIFAVRAFQPPDSYFVVPGVWLKDRTVLFTAASRAAVNIWSVRLNPNGSSDEPRHWTDGTETETYPAAVIMPNETTRAVYAALTIGTNIWKIPLNSAGSLAGEPAPLVTGQYQAGSPSLSADGSQMTFSAKQPVGVNIQLVNLLRPALAPRVLRIEEGLYRPMLSGDGGTVAFRGTGSKGYLMPLKTSAPDEVCQHCSWPTHVSFDGKKAIFEQGDLTKEEDLLLAERGQKPRTLLHIQNSPHWDQSSGRFSPDEKWVAFSGWHKGDTARQILIAPLTGDGTIAASQLVQITHDEFVNTEPVWEPRGRRIYFISNRDGYQCVWAQNIEPGSMRPNGEEFQVAHFHNAGQKLQGPFPNAGSIGLSAAENFLILTLTDSKGNIWGRATVSDQARREGERTQSSSKSNSK